MTQRRIYAISKNNTEHDNGEKTNHLNYALKVIQKKKHQFDYDCLNITIGNAYVFTCKQ